MKKILYSVFMLATMVLAACSSDDTTEPVVKRGMVLKANVENTDTRATMTKNKDVYKFAFAAKDVVKVGNDKVESYYTFTNDGTVFASADAKQTTDAATWYAYFPDKIIDLTNQSGDSTDVANNYALAGATASATTGSDGLTVTMKAKVAVLRIVGVNKDDILDISVKTDDGYVSGLKADKNSADFKVETKDTKVSLLSKQGAGVYYIVVPAGVKISVYNGNEPLYSGDKTMSTTKADGLKAGKYYTLTTGMTKGSAKNKLGDDIGWVQLWPGGPKFATENVAKTLNRSEATAEGSAYVWGANWRTPTKEEMNFVNEHALTPINVKAEVQVQNGVPGILYTGIQPGYTDKTIFLSSNTAQSSKEYFQGVYWTSTEGEQSNGVSLNFLGGEGVVYMYYFDNNASTVTANLVRPVLAK